jgi:hypothetical protein
MRGWRGYFGFCETPEVLVYLTRWVRLRLRAAFSRWTARDGLRVGSATTSPAVQYRREGTSGDLAQGQSRRSGVGAESLDETARKLDGEGHFDIADWDGVLESLCLLEVAIGLALGDNAIPGQSLGRLGPMLMALQKGTGEVEAFGFLDMAGARH